jgi:hypothetical protein
MLDPKLDCFREMRLFDLMIFSDDSYVRIECDFSFFSSLTFSDELTTLLDDEVLITS